MLLCPCPKAEWPSPKIVSPYPSIRPFYDTIEATVQYYISEWRNHVSAPYHDDLLGFTLWFIQMLKGFQPATKTPTVFDEIYDVFDSIIHKGGPKRGSNVPKLELLVPGFTKKLTKGDARVLARYSEVMNSIESGKIRQNSSLATEYLEEFNTAYRKIQGTRFDKSGSVRWIIEKFIAGLAPSEQTLKSLIDKEFLEGDNELKEVTYHTFYKKTKEELIPLSENQVLNYLKRKMQKPALAK